MAGYQPPILGEAQLMGVIAEEASQERYRAAEPGMRSGLL